MAIDFTLEFQIFVLVALGGLALEVFLSQVYLSFFKQHIKIYHFALARYLLLLIPPLLAFLILVARIGLSPLNAFFVFMLVGTICEWLIGYFYQKLIGQRLWTYHRFSIQGYTSLLSIPIWGCAGVLFWLLINLLAG